MKKIGFIDFYLDEFHANNYPKWISGLSAGEMEVHCAYALQDSPNPGGMTTAQWCDTHGIPQAASIAELVDSCDCINVLSPDNPEMHRLLAELPLKSGKPVYVDKTFAPTAAIAKELFSIAQDNGTPCFSASALRFATEYKEVNKDEIEQIISRGPGPLTNYAIHQIEPIVLLMGNALRRVQYIGTRNFPALLLEWTDGRRAQFSHHGWECPFQMQVDTLPGKSSSIKVNSDYFENFIREMVDFFQTGTQKVPHADTIAVIAAIEASLQASENPDTWIPIIV